MPSEGEERERCEVQRSLFFVNLKSTIVWSNALAEMDGCREPFVKWDGGLWGGEGKEGMEWGTGGME